MKKIFLVISILLFATLACNAVLPQTESTATPFTQVTATQQEQSTIPLTEAGVPRISAADSKAAFDSGKAIIVDVRSADSFAAGHIRGAINIPLTDIENNPAGVKLDKGQWIITYCT
jgi:3-mercaptopyruvate sulfurtransferase SseA